MSANYSDGDSSDLGLAVLKVICSVPKIEDILSCGHETEGLAGGKTLALS